MVCGVESKLRGVCFLGWKAILDSIALLFNSRQTYVVKINLLEADYGK